MRPSDCLRVGWQALRVNTGRSLLTTLGVVVGVAAVICTMSIGAGTEDEVAETLRTLGANLLAVTPGAANARGVRMEAGGRRNLTEGDAAAIRRELPEVQIAAPLVSKRLQVIAGSRNWSTLVAGVTPDYLDAREWSAAEGRLIDAADLDSGARVAVVGSNVADALFDARPAVGETIRIGKVPATIIAVLSPKGSGAAGRSQDDIVFVPLSTAKSRLLGTANFGTRDSPISFPSRWPIRPRCPRRRVRLRRCSAAGIDCGLTRRTTFQSKTPPTSCMRAPAQRARSPGCSSPPPRFPWWSAASAS